MADTDIAEIARRLADAMMLRARTRQPDDQKAVLAIQTELCRAVLDERQLGAVE